MIYGTELRMVTATPTTIKPARKLGEHGSKLWTTITQEYEIVDAGGIEMLTLACQQLDRAEALRKQIDADGEIVKGTNGPKEHPGLRHELAARAFVVRTLHRLGLDVEPLNKVGRPGGPVLA